MVKFQQKENESSEDKIVGGKSKAACKPISYEQIAIEDLLPDDNERFVQDLERLLFEGESLTLEKFKELECKYPGKIRFEGLDR